MLRDTKKEAIIEEEIFHAGLEPWQRTLLEAVEIIRKKGWCQHSIVGLEGQVCLEGAVMEAVGITAQVTESTVCGKILAVDYFVDGIKIDISQTQYGERMREANTILSHLQKYLDTRSAWGWNDRPHRTQADVEKALITCALG